MSDQILQKLEALERGQGELKAGQEALRAELLRAVRESNEAVLWAIRALHDSLRETRERIRAAG